MYCTGMDYHGGGGFDQGGGGGGFGGGIPSPSQPKGRRSYDDKTITPITIKMALSGTTAEDGNKLVLEDGRKLSQVCIVAATRSVEDFSTNSVYLLEDGTGLIECKQWLDDNDSTGTTAIRAQTMHDNIYLKVVGTVRDYDGKKTIVADSVRPLSTANEITHHMLSVIYSAETYKQRHSYDLSHHPMMGGVGFGSGPVPAMASGASFQDMSTGGRLADIVYEYIRTQGAMSEAGANIQQCVDALTMQGHSEGAIRKAIDDLNNEGHIYSTVDDHNFKTAN
jgi:replication factor A2